mmetsp:Transcript_3373/g.4707  ORF Transcript_3373/g.4707 Transcript_3373/m.4707 type:complete len:89 (+) Transcript_3373:122-388(+)
MMMIEITEAEIRKVNWRRRACRLSKYESEIGNKEIEKKRKRGDEESAACWIFISKRIRRYVNVKVMMCNVCYIKLREKDLRKCDMSNC